ncbi:MAG: V-type ATPase subunit [Candidatus Omnitrophica bacterium]|nr:V-type ATPase subunit [Candidatus Omnitrophota bacterium]
MRQISRYAYPNTRIRAALSELLDEDFFSRASGMDFYAFLDALEKTTYANIIKNRDTITPEEFELSCTEYNRKNIRKLASFFRSKNEKQVILLLEQRYSIEQLKFFLRLWNKKQQFYGSAGEFSEILKARTIDDIIELLKDTGYSYAIERAKEKFEKTGSLYPIEISIDREYFLRLQEAINKLSSTDMYIAKNIIGAEIDRENLLWLARIKLYYPETVPVELSGFIPGGAHLSENDFKKLMKQNMSADELRMPAQYVEIIEKLPGKLTEIDRILEDIIINHIRKTLVQKPFSVGIPLGYIFLKLKETRRVISIFISKYLSSKIYQ